MVKIVDSDELRLCSSMCSSSSERNCVCEESEESGEPPCNSVVGTFTWGNDKIGAIAVAVVSIDAISG